MGSFRKSLAIVLCIVMCMSLYPASALAEEGEPVPEDTQIAELTEHEHTYIAVITEPSCTKSGYTTYTCACGDSYVDDYTEVLGHTPETIEAVPASCTEPGCTALW